MGDLLDDLLKELQQVASRAITLEDNGFTYVIYSENHRTRNVRKLVGESAVNYRVQRFKGGWTCTCPAGLRSRECKHVLWVSVIANSPQAQKLGFVR